MMSVVQGILAQSCGAGLSPTYSVLTCVTCNEKVGGLSSAPAHSISAKASRGSVVFPVFGIAKILARWNAERELAAWVQWWKHDKIDSDAASLIVRPWYNRDSLSVGGRRPSHSSIVSRAHRFREHDAVSQAVSKRGSAGENERSLGIGEIMALNRKREGFSTLRSVPTVSSSRRGAARWDT